MVIDITNSCKMGCPHCLQRSTPEPQHMDWKTILRALDFAKWSGARCVLISGGELTEHPEWHHVVEAFAGYGQFLSIILATNGMWIGDEVQERRMLDLLERFPKIRLQVTTVNGLYPLHEEAERKVEAFKGTLRERKLKHRLDVSREIEAMIALGRACDHEELLNIAAADTHKTTSCLSSALVAAQTTFVDAIRLLEQRGMVCHPLVDWQGNVHWSESWLCPSFGNVHEDFFKVFDKGCAWRPCGKCHGYRKLMASREPKYVMARTVLGLR